MTEDELRTMEDRCNGATPEPWVERSRDIDGHDGAFLGWEIDGPPAAYRGQFARGADAKFIAHARTDEPRLIAEVRRLQARVERAEAQRDLLLGAIRDGQSAQSASDGLRSVGDDSCSEDICEYMYGIADALDAIAEEKAP